MNELLKLLEEGIDLLKRYNVKWFKILMKMKAELLNIKTKEEGSCFLKNNELNIYGGMGSLYDIFICPENGNVADNFDIANEQLEDYRKRLSREWQRLKRKKKGSPIEIIVKRKNTRVKGELRGQALNVEFNLTILLFERNEC